jgi:hypothetical protein
MPANQVGSLSPTRSGPVENDHKIFRRYNCKKPFSVGEDMEETAGKKISGHSCVVEEMSNGKSFTFLSKK